MKRKRNTRKHLEREIPDVKCQGWGQTRVIFTLEVMLQHLSQNLEQNTRDYSHRVIEGFIAAARQFE